MTKSICLFNHKGGVSKTTTTFHLGWGLAERGHKVMMVDLDSQCNLTGIIMGLKAIDYDKMEEFYSNQDNITMKSVAEAVISGSSPIEFLRANKSQLLATNCKNLLLLPGHLDISNLDSQINVALKIAHGLPAMKNIPGNLPMMLQEIAKKEKNRLCYLRPEP